MIGKFPFITGVGISGSLSKNYADAEADIDYFIITEANRLWIARTLLHCLKKLSFLVGRQHWFCMNYFIDEQALVMPEKNLFIATEVITLKPVSGTAFPSFFSANRWVLEHFPNQLFPVFDFHTAKKHGWIKKWIESMFANKTGDRLDGWLMRVTYKRWLVKERTQRLNRNGHLMSIRIGRHFGRPNPDHFQKKILAQYDRKLEEIEAAYCFREPAFAGK